jgi:hypothetical protein
MPKITLQGGMHLEVPNREENREDVARVMDERELVQARGLKWMRLPVLLGTPAGSAVTIDGAHGQPPVGPESGYAWSLRRIVVDGMTTGATPDVINMYRNSAGGTQAPLWQFNGNNFGYTFGRLEMTLTGGDSLTFASVGTFAATGTIRVTGELVEVPAEMLYKIAV